MTKNYRCRNCGEELSGNWLYCSDACQSECRKRFGMPRASYGRETLRGAPVRSCTHCDKLIHGRRSQYCSDACKQAAYRKRKDPGVGDWSRKSDRAQKAVHTKQTTYIKLTCEHCGDERSWTIASGALRRYCSDKCKQAAYRQRKALLAQDVTK